MAPHFMTFSQLVADSSRDKPRQSAGKCGGRADPDHADRSVMSEDTCDYCGQICEPHLEDCANLTCSVCGR